MPYVRFRHAIPFCLCLLQAVARAQLPLSSNLPASGVLGQLDFTSRAAGTSAGTLQSPAGVAVDSRTGCLFVVDRYNNRILRWSSAAKLTDGSAAEAVLGQPDFVTATRGLSSASLNDPLRAYVDAAGRLWVSDYGNNRVLRFDDAATKPMGAAADGVLGQPDFTTGTSGLSATKMNRPMGAYEDGKGHLWVCEDDNNRALRFDHAAARSNGAAADGVLGQPDFTSNAKRATRDGVSNLRGVSGDPAGRLYLTDESNHRIVIFADAASKPNGANADFVLGQPGFNDSTALQQEVYDPASLNYLLFMPRDTSARIAGKYPLIISLHGIGESGTTLSVLKNEGLPALLDGNGTFPFIVVSPQCPSTTEWYYGRTDLKEMALLDSVIARYPVDTNRIYLTGYSMGGIGTLNLAIRYPARFAAVLPCAFRVEPDWDVCAMKDVPMWGFHGRLDPVIPLAGAQSVVSALTACGGNPQFTIYQDAYHDAWTQTYANPAVYAWLLSKTKQNRNSLGR